MTADAGKPEFNPYLHGLRGLAALAVFVCHCFTIMRDNGLWPQSWHWFGESLHMGRYGVEVFFLISGYLITESLQRKGSVRHFLIERAIRLQPAYFGVLLPLFLFKLLTDPGFLDGAAPWTLPLHFLANLFFLPGVFPVPIALAVGWTLSFEALFYLTASGAFLLAPRYSTAAAASVCVMVGAVAASLYPGAVFFFIGAGAHLYRPLLQRLLRRWHWPALALLLWLVPFNVVLWAYADGHRISALGMLVLMACMPLSLLFFTPTVDGRGVIAALLRHEPFQYLGKVSYSLYLWHAPILAVACMVLRHKLPVGGPVLPLAVVAVSLPLTLIAAHLSWWVCEQTLGTVLRRRLLPRRSAA